ncbi:cobalamin biosynthesis protein CbiG [Deinococcus phoenicis]|uniref:Cobalamin biosynthesis protein CbiG n=1 Tax=Deinococcus phoenicis TaxID=1476583 RepID=A0A016QSM3_9DEIO|nr:cobalamin biosynthesis protein [Deinococcus phoenicis]EYB69001.1 cobalamin biosynthesis protein CbiG [Deinococcus phoenicis]
MTAAPQSLAVWPVRRESEGLAARLADELGAALHRPWQEAGRQMDAFRAAFHTARAWVFIGAAGIATRFVSGLPHSKLTDPAVVVLDDAARFAVALLGGHEGGANALAYRVARLTGAVPVVTTATEAVKPLTLGIGCRRGVSEEQIAAAVAHTLGERSLTDVREVATVDLKADEAGLLAFCERHGLPLRIFAAADLEARPFVTRHSEWVQQSVGLSGVCEPCALLASPRGRLTVPKTALNGVTVAVVEDRGAAVFEEKL